LTKLPASLLVSHGSRDPRPNMAMLNLATIIRHQFGLSYLSENKIANSLNQIQPILVETACLELGSVPLHQRITEFAHLALNNGITRVNIFPLFLSPGVHVQEDLPWEISLAQQNLAGKIELCLLPYLGSNLRIQDLLQEEFHRLNCEGKIILAHGSKRQGGNQLIENIADILSSQVAYWSVSPNLETQVLRLMQQGMNKIAIVPYFLFSGAITEAIANQVISLQTKYPQVELIFGSTLEKNPNLVELIMGSLQGANYDHH
jgi:sirohydrochlorin cobaltochelatase